MGFIVMNFQKEANISFEKIFFDKSGMPSLEDFHLQIGPSFSFI